jgi:hypothetical protein
MADLPAVNPVRTSATLDQEVESVLVGLQPGWYITRDLYQRYKVWAEQGSKPVVSPNAFGMAMGRITNQSTTAHGHVKAWYVTEQLSNPGHRA